MQVMSIYVFLICIYIFFCYH